MNGIESPDKERVELLLEIFTVMCITLLYVKHGRNDQPVKSIFVTKIYAIFWGKIMRHVTVNYHLKE